MEPEATARADAAAREKRVEIQRRRENTCNRCNRVRHWMADCPWKVASGFATNVTVTKTTTRSSAQRKFRGMTDRITIRTEVEA